MLDAHDSHNLCFVVDLVENAIVADSKSPVILRTCYFFTALWMRVACCRLSRHLTPFLQIKMTPLLLNLLQLIFQPIAAASDIEDAGMMHQSVYNSRCNHIIIKTPCPTHRNCNYL
jgi:hypothetical protein